MQSMDNTIIRKNDVPQTSLAFASSLDPLSLDFTESTNTAYCIAFRMLPAWEHLLACLRLGSDYGGVEV